MSEKISATIEDYLGVMYVLQRDGEPVTGVTLARLIGVAPPTVTNTLKRMVRDGLVSMDAPGGPRLTEHGLDAARTLMRRHMLAEWMLARVISWSRVHKEAHEFEHAISDAVEAALLAELNDPDTCPHGNPLPGHEQAVAPWVPLTRAPTGQVLTVRRIHELAEDDEDIMAFLEQNGILPGREILIREVLAFNQTMNIEVGGRALALGFAVARYIFAEIEPGQTENHLEE